MTKKIRQQKAVVNDDSTMQYMGSDGTGVRVVFSEGGSTSWSGGCSGRKNWSDK